MAVCIAVFVFILPATGQESYSTDTIETHGTLFLEYTSEAQLAALLKGLSDAPYDRAAILYPPEGAVFPSNFGAPYFKWRGGADDAVWLLSFSFESGHAPLRVVTRRKYWEPALENLWESIKIWSKNRAVTMDVVGGDIGESGKSPRPVSRARSVRFRVSPDPVDDIITYRLLACPIGFGGWGGSQIYYQSVASNQVGLFGLPPLGHQRRARCLGCHNPSPDGAKMLVAEREPFGLAVVDAREMRVERRIDYFSSDDPSAEKKKEGLIGYPMWDWQSRRFAFVKGRQSPILAGLDEIIFTARPADVWTAEDGQSPAPLPGASSPGVEEYAPSWSADAKTIAFVRRLDKNWEPFGSRRPALRFPLFIPKRNVRIADFIGKGEIYMIPYNDGKGGAAKPLAGASDNGRFNSYPRYSPDGRWLAFCQSNDMDFADAGSDIYLVPAAGGEPIRLASNMEGVRDSWPAWSSNGKWLAFVSNRHESGKPKIYVMEIDDKGSASVPVLLPYAETTPLCYNHPFFIKKAPTKDFLTR